MKIELKQIKVRDIVSGYTNNEEEGVTGFSGTTTLSNLQMISKLANARKGGK